MSEQEKRDNTATPKESVSSDKKAKAPKKKEQKPNRLLRWLKDLKGELKKVTWPSLKDTVKTWASSSCASSSWAFSSGGSTTSPVR